MSSRLTITCDRCNAEVTHRCNANLVEAIVDLYTWGPERGMPDYMIREGKRAGYYEKGDEQVPFMSESFLYTALGKEDARSLLGIVGQLVAAIGIDELGINKAVNARLEAIKADREARTLQQRRQQLVYQIKCAGADGFDVEEPEWALLQHLAKLTDRFAISEPFKKRSKQWRKYTYTEKAESDRG